LTKNWVRLTGQVTEMTGTNQREAGSQLAFDQLSTGF